MFQIARNFFVLSFLLSVSQQTLATDLLGEWICTHPWKQVGVVFDLGENGKITVGSIWNDSSTVLPYRFKGDTLFIEKSGQFQVLGILEGKTSAGFKLNTIHAKSWTFVKVSSSQVQETREQILSNMKGTPWIFRTGQDSMRIDFRATRIDDNESLLLESLTHYSIDGIAKKKEMWDVRKYNGKLFLFFTNYMFGPTLRQIERASTSSLTLAQPFRLGKVDVFTLEKKDALNPSQRQRLIEMISHGRLMSVTTDTLYAHNGHFRKGKKLNAVLDLAFLRKKIAFEFSKDYTYRIFADIRSWQKGRWELTADGEYLILDDAKDERNWINLIKKDGKLTLAKFQEFEIKAGESKMYLLKFNVEREK